MACYQGWWQAAFVKAQLKDGPILRRSSLNPEWHNLYCWFHISLIIPWK
jgi:hypothetical protein